MRSRSKAPDSGATITKLATILVLVLAALLVWGVVLVRDKLLLNANSMGGYLAQSYAEREGNRFTYYAGLISSCVDSLNEGIEEGDGPEELSYALQEYSSYFNGLVGREAFDMYAVVDGAIVAATPWEGDEGYDYASTDWYGQALAQDGSVFTGVYVDAITGSRVVTLSQRLSGEGNVLATDIRLDQLSAVVSTEDMPRDSAYYLVDGNGELIFKQSSLDVTTDEGRDYFDKLVSSIRSNEYEDPNATITDLTGTTRGVYYFEMEDGWLSIVTIPLANILQEGWSSVFVSLGAISALTIVALFVAILRERVQSRQGREMGRTLRILGERHYAIYQIDLDSGRYKVVKAPPDLPSDIALEGPYEDLLGRMEGIVDPSAYAEFTESFSLERIRSYLRDDIEDFGGDFQRLFGDEYRWVNVRCVYSKEICENEALLCFRDVEREKRATLQHRELLENALKAAKKTEMRKNAFFSGVSHDMRTPLNAIVGLSSLLERHAGDPESVRDYAQKINRSGEQLLTLVNDILDLSRLDATGDRKIDAAPLDLARCLSDCIDTFRHKVGEDGKSLTVSGLDRPIPVYGDSDRLTQVFNNLLSNAVKYTREGDAISVDLKVVSEDAAAPKYQITVADTGIGMSEEFLGRLFEPFSRETRFAPANIVGTGLGMPIVKSLVQRMSGEITVESVLGEGTTFVVTLPLLPASREDVEPGGREGPATASVESLDGITVLVAEDNDINMEVLRELLELMGAKVVTTYDGEEAVHAFSSSEPGEIDVILMDMHMPNMDGCEACRAIRALDRDDAPRVPILAVTANAFAEDVAKTTRAGMNGHLTKPISAAALCDAIARAVSARRSSAIL